MTTEEKIKKELIQRFGDAYKAFGLSKLMGHIIALLLFSPKPCLLYTSDAADERSSVDLGGRRIIKKKNNIDTRCDTERQTLTITITQKIMRNKEVIEKRYRISE